MNTEDSINNHGKNNCNDTTKDLTNKKKRNGMTLI